MTPQQRALLRAAIREYDRATQAHEDAVYLAVKAQKGWGTYLDPQPTWSEIDERIAQATETLDRLVADFTNP